MSEGSTDNANATVTATLVGAALAVAALAAAGWLVFQRTPPVDAKAPPPVVAPETRPRHQESWVYFRGDDLRPVMESLADFDIVLAPLAGADVASVKWLESRGCRVVAEEPRFGGLLADGRGEKTVGKIDGAVCWIGANFSEPGNRILAQENKKTVDALREYAASHPGEKVLVFAAGLPQERWKTFRILMSGFGFVPSAGPADASAIYDYVHESAAAAPRPVMED